jgi:hypothetical protein
VLLPSAYHRYSATNLWLCLDARSKAEATSGAPSEAERSSSALGEAAAVYLCTGRSKSFTSDHGLWPTLSEWKSKGPPNIRLISGYFHFKSEGKYFANLFSLFSLWEIRPVRLGSS